MTSLQQRLNAVKVERGKVFRKLANASRAKGIVNLVHHSTLDLFGVRVVAVAIGLIVVRHKKVYTCMDSLPRTRTRSAGANVEVLSQNGVCCG